MRLCFFAYSKAKRQMRDEAFSVMMLDWLGYEAESRRIENAVTKVYAAGKVRTGDLGGTASTSDFTKAVIDAMA